MASFPGQPGPLSGTTQVSRYQKGKTFWILLKQEAVNGSGVSWAICKSAPHSRQTTMPAPKKVKPIWILLEQETVSGSGII